MKPSKSVPAIPGDFIIAGKKRVRHWQAFKGALAVGRDRAPWSRAFRNYFHARLTSRYLKPLDILQKNGTLRGEGFSIVAIQCSLIEYLESTLQGKSYRYRRNGDPPLQQHEYSNSGSMFEAFLTTRTPFNTEFTPQLAHDFYASVRCGVLHEARTKNGWTIRAKSKTGQMVDSSLRIVYRDNFQTGLGKFVRWYKTELPSNVGLQAAFLRKFDSLCV
jgi:hypothetical protein